MPPETPDTEDGPQANRQAPSPFRVEKRMGQQGRVAAATQILGSQINDDGGLERCADELGARALRVGEPLDTELTYVSSPMQERPL